MLQEIKSIIEHFQQGLLAEQEASDQIVLQLCKSEEEAHQTVVQKLCEAEFYTSGENDGSFKNESDRTYFHTFITSIMTRVDDNVLEEAAAIAGL